MRRKTFHLQLAITQSSFDLQALLGRDDRSGNGTSSCMRMSIGEHLRHPGQSRHTYPASLQP